jgi:hypothetical protein
MAIGLNELPPPCEECAPEGRFRIIEIRGETVYARCRCKRGRLLAAMTNRPVPPQRAEPVLTADEISGAVEGLSAIPWFPKEEGARTMIADAIARLCSDSRSCFELVRRMVDGYKEWPGVREMRICYCALVGLPLSGEDLHLAVSEYYPDGFGGPVVTTVPKLVLPSGARPERTLDDATWRAALEKDLTTIPPQKPYMVDPVKAEEDRLEFLRQKRETLREQHRAAMADLKPITQDDFKKAEAEYYQKKMERKPD